MISMLNFLSVIMTLELCGTISWFSGSICHEVSGDVMSITFYWLMGGGKFNVRRERNKANIGMKNQLETLSEGFMSIHCTTLTNLNF